MLALNPADMAARELRMTTRTHKLENIYHECLQAAALANEAESSRRLRLKIALLEQENEDLREQAWQHEAEIDDLHASRDELAEEVATNTKASDALRVELRAKTRQVETLTAELHSMKGLSSDSSKILSEKLALSRELSALKPQMEHLQAQLSANQNVLAEKLSLQRELSAIQVELDNERRSSAKARSRDSDPSVDLEKFNTQIEQLRADLAKEKREREKAAREHSAKLEEAEGNSKLMESRMEAFRTKLKATKDELKEAQEQIHAKAAKPTKTTKQRESTEDAGKMGLTKKRSLTQMDPDAALGTPGDHLPMKRGRRLSTALAGEKSSFSITPFLNKTGDISAEIPSETPSRSRPESRSVLPGQEDSDDTIDITQSKKNTVVQTKITDGPSAARAGNKGNTLKAQRSIEKLARKSNLDQVAEENDENEQEGNKTSVSYSKKTTRGGATEPGKPAVKKKRILLGKTLFDDDEDTTISRRDDSIFSKSGLSLGGRSIGKPGARLGSRLSNIQGSSFTAFSPLKRDRSVLA